ncbi:MAG TPA: (2Fe-2S)-binding protein [Acidimicrobiales bacterium]|nr:(2Fe-2S)-binding protein [Acidimicrobiales bacterium]
MTPAEMSHWDGLPLGLAEPNVVVTMEVNGTVVTAQVPTRLHLADFLRHELHLTGTHVGCEQGVCGMCTVLVDGEAVKSCLMLAAQADGCRVETVESLAPDDDLSPLQQKFKEEHGLQCGFCTPAFLMTATALARSDARLDDRELKEELAGVMCRCTGYEFILRAIRRHLQEDPTSEAPE